LGQARYGRIAEGIVGQQIWAMTGAAIDVAATFAVPGILASRVEWAGPDEPPEDMPPITGAWPGTTPEAGTTLPMAAAMPDVPLAHPLDGRAARPALPRAESVTTNATVDLVLPAALTDTRAQDDWLPYGQHDLTHAWDDKTGEWKPRTGPMRQALH